MSALPQPYMTPAEYLAFERNQEQKHEYWHGQVYLMAGAKARHNLITANVIAGLHLQLRGRSCSVYPSDMRVLIPATGLYTYPDALVVCGKAEFEDTEEDTLLNPTVVIEVLSKSTEQYDRGDKFRNYRTIPTLQEYLLIAQDERRVEHFVRQANTEWLLTEMSDATGAIDLPTIDCTLAMADLYDKVSMPPRPRILREQYARYSSQPA
jgi:Uma2 family endonuclease